MKIRWLIFGGVDINAPLRAATQAVCLQMDMYHSRPYILMVNTTSVLRLPLACIALPIAFFLPLPMSRPAESRRMSCLSGWFYRRATEITRPISVLTNNNTRLMALCPGLPG